MYFQKDLTAIRNKYKLIKQMRMRVIILLVVISCGVMLFSCNSTDGNKNLKNQSSSMLENSLIQDSIAKAEEFELKQARQDSIDAAQIKGYSVKKLSGKHKYGGVTKIEYKSLAQLIDEVKVQSEKEMWQDGKLESTIDVYKRAWKGGLVKMYIERNTIGAANTDMFSIIIKDTDENELHRAELENNIPNYSSDDWWNFGYAYIEERIKTPFYVYVVDKLEDAPFKFEVTSIKK